MRKTFWNNTRWYVAICIALLLGVAIGTYWQPKTNAGALPTYSADVDIFGYQYKFINPLLFCSDQELSKLTSATAQKIEKDVEDYIDKMKLEGKLLDAAMYFRDLKSGPWALINEDLYSAPASLLKVPLALSIYKHAEVAPGFLSKTILFEASEDFNVGQFFQSSDKALSGKAYSIEELVKFSLIDSDNNATYALTQLLNQGDLEESYTRLGITSPDGKTGSYSMKVRTYASFFRILYNASYLERTESEYILSLLSQSKFTIGIVAGTPGGTTVAHKFGETRFPNGDTQLHDCGIIYKPGQPYLLCIMTHGNDFKIQSQIIADISRIIWNILKE
ncbi:MAG: beta-lactamase [Parcubacteria group bacterium Gr01-1014_56]|nr:MAG: beta-lactamase [Parcubacteria group bacterium Gr01-1014_56]